MIYEVITTDKFDRAIKRLDRQVQRTIKSWIDKNLSGTNNPRRLGKSLTADLAGIWRYRIGDYRLLVEIHDDKLIIIAVGVGHRSNVYR